MANAHNTSDPNHDLAHEIDRLIKKLPNADPKLVGEPEPYLLPLAPRPALAGAGAPAVPAVTATRATPTASRASSDRASQIHTWSRALLAASFGAAVTQYPYVKSCGWMLYLYLGVIAVVLIAGAWASAAAWRARIAAAHALSLVVVYWGIVLAAEQILPRIGYAAATAQWACLR
jgi:hypothetical protein